ncbi:MAG: hypothetical protein IPH75_00065 [bacterium]|nr:hypothetical protein [bacterium]
MDVLAHALWTNLAFSEAPLPVRGAAIALSVLPDLIPFTPTAVRQFFSARKDQSGNPKPRPRPEEMHFSRWAYRAYDVTHSLLVFGAVFAAGWLWMGSVPWVLFGWLGHILVDIPTHTRAFFGTPIFWPISNYKFDGISWGERWFMRLNYGGIILMYAYYIATSYLVS